MVYCRNCYVYDDEGKVICLECAKRRVTPKGPKSKYFLISEYLARRAKYSGKATLSFARIEEIIGEKLPLSAYNRYWWRNTWNNSHSTSWMTVGWRVLNVDIELKKVTFERTEQETTGTNRKRKRGKPVSASFKALAYRVKPKRRRELSKTRIAKTQARLKNVVRRKAEPKRYTGRLKPK
jgi:hypothetical protein